MTLAVMAFAVTVAALVQGAIGVGFALIVAPIAAALRPDLLPGSILFLMLPLNAYVAGAETLLFRPSRCELDHRRPDSRNFAGLSILVAVRHPS